MVFTYVVVNSKDRPLKLTPATLYCIRGVPQLVHILPVQVIDYLMPQRWPTK